MRTVIEQIWTNGIANACSKNESSTCPWGSKRKQHYDTLLRRYEDRLIALQIPIARLMKESTQVPMDDMGYTECLDDEHLVHLVGHPPFAYRYSFEGQMERLEQMLSLSIERLEEPVDCDISRIVDPNHLYT